MSNKLFVAEAKERPLVKREFSTFAKSEDERLMIKVHKANIKAASKAEYGDTKWRPQNRLVFLF